MKEMWQKNHIKLWYDTIIKYYRKKNPLQMQRVFYFEKKRGEAMAKQREVAKEKCKTCVWKTKVGTNSNGEVLFCMFGNCFCEKEEKRKQKNELKSSLDKPG